ncbi:hypothetical protein ABZ897_13645 [Nonomuraea sp. NPDC046802]
MVEVATSAGAAFGIVGKDDLSGDVGVHFGQFGYWTSGQGLDAEGHRG